MKKNNAYPFGITNFELKYGNNITRIVVGVVAIPLVLYCIYFGGISFYIFCAIINLLALFEFYSLFSLQEQSPNKILGYLFSIAFFLIPLFKSNTQNYLIALLVLFPITLLLFELKRNCPKPATNVAITMLGVFYVTFSIGCFLMLRNEYIAIPSVENNSNLIFAVLISIWVCDSFAYFAGRAFGKHKLFERISPKKTWEGFIAGVIGAMLTVLLFNTFLLKLGLLHSIVIGIISGVLGQLGDLCESMLKRSVGVKDSSLIIPGHGGVLDRFDSLLFVAPLVFVYLKIFS